MACDECGKGECSINIKQYVDIRFQDASDAVKSALASSNDRLHAMNEWRVALDKLTESKVSRDEYLAGYSTLITKTDHCADQVDLDSKYSQVQSDSSSRHNTITAKVESMERDFGLKIVNLEKYVSSMKGIIWVLAGVGGLAGVIIPILLKYLPILLMRGP